jgi:hypothetical protein
VLSLRAHEEFGLVRATTSTKKKNQKPTVVPNGRNPSVVFSFFLASGPDFSRTDITRQAMKPARQKRKTKYV